MEQVFHKKLQFSMVSIILPTVHTHSLTHSSTIYVISLTMLLHYKPKQAVVIILQVGGHFM